LILLWAGLFLLLFNGLLRTKPDWEGGLSGVVGGLACMLGGGLALYDLFKSTQHERASIPLPVHPALALLLTGAVVLGSGWLINEVWWYRSWSRGPWGSETAAIGALKTIGTAQSLFREADKEDDGNLDYGTLKELANVRERGLIDRVLGSGTKNHYLFQVTYGASTSEFLWYATASPRIPGLTGDRYFASNHEGVTYYTTTRAFSLNGSDCTIPAGVQPVGR
jgi:hypothetical protein